MTYFLDLKSRPSSIVFGDFDNNKQIDVAITDSYHEVVIILYGLRNGNYSGREIYSTGYESLPSSIVVGDFNKDDNLDIIVANTGTNKIEVISRYSYKPFSKHTIYTSENVSSPNFIIIADFNNDNQSDLVIASDENDNVAIFLGIGNESFVPYVTYSTGNGSAPRSIAFADFNNDDILDIATANYNSDNVAVLLGFGNGSFRNLVTYSTGFESYPSSIVTADFNNDKQSDIAVTNIGSNEIIVFLGDGNGTFSQVMTYKSEEDSFPRFIVVGDVNNDNKLDIIVCKFGSFKITIFLGYGNGTFEPENEYLTETDSSPLWAVVSDFNNDKQIDIATLNYPSGNVAILLGNGNGSFRILTLYSSGQDTSARSMTVGDFNNDYHIDIATANYGTNSIGLLFGYGNGTFASVETYALGNGFQPYAVTAGNINNDDWLDLVVGYPGVGDIDILIGFDYAYDAIQNFYSTGSGSHPTSISVSDFNNDSKLDMAITNTGLENIGIRLGYGNGSFSTEITYSIGYHSNPEYLTTGDFNLDKKIDIVTANPSNDTITILYGYGDGTFQRQETYYTGYSSIPYSLAIGDFNNDRRPDVAVGNVGSNSVGVFLSFNYVTFTYGQIYSTGFDSASYAICIGDFNHDNQSDIVVTNKNRANFGIFLGFGDGKFSSQITFETGHKSFPNYLAIDDFNHDTHLDVVVVNSIGNNIGIFLGYGNGSFSPQKAFSTGSQSSLRGVVTGDLNNDKHSDIVVAYYSTNQIGVFLGHGNGNFTALSTLSTGSQSQPHSVAISDLNSDKQLDIVATNNGNFYISIFFGYGNGSFSKPIMYSTGDGSFPVSVAIDDLNNDHQLDIVVTNEGTNNIGIFFGYGNGTFTNQKTYSTDNGALPFCVVIADLNNDNERDIVSVNFGSNTISIFFGYGNGSFTSQMIVSTGIGSNPSGIGIGDFNNDNRFDIAIANWGTDSMLTLLQDGDQPFLNPVIYSTGNNSKPYSVAVGDFNNDSQLDIVVANYGSGNVGILLGYKDGNFESQSVYSTGYKSGPNSIDVGDFNNDHRLDIVVVNSLANLITILIGYGDGTFFIKSSYSSGIDSNPQMVLVYDINKDDRLDFIVTNTRSNKIHIYSGYGNGTFNRTNTYMMSYKSQPYGIAVGDFNNDSWIDMAVSTYGADSIEILLQTC